MATPFNQFGQTLMFEGLGTFTLFTAPFAGLFEVDGKISIPTISSGDGQSSVLATVKKNGSTISNGAGVAGAQGFNYQVQLASGDVMSVVLSSAAAADQGLNKIKTTVASSYLFV